MEKDEFERRVQAAIEGDFPETETKLDESLRALVAQLHEGTSAPSSGRHRMVRADAPREDLES